MKGGASTDSHSRALVSTDQSNHGHSGSRVSLLGAGCTWCCQQQGPARHNGRLQGLSKLIGDHAPAAVKTQQFENYFGRKIAVDASLCLYQFLVRFHR